MKRNINFIIFKNLLVVILFSIILTNKTYSQQDLTISDMSIIPQSSYMNPAFKPVPKWYIGIPALSSVYAGLCNNGFVYKNVFHFDPSDDSLHFTMDNVVKKLGKHNFVSANIMEEILAFGFRVKKSYFNFSVTDKASFRFGYSKDFMSMIWNGNGQFVGKTADFSGTGINASYYREYALGYSRDVKIADQNFTFGCRLKFIQGIMSVYTKSHSATYSINGDDFGYSAKESFLVNMDIPNNIATDLDSIGSKTYKDTTNFTMQDLKKIVTNMNNKGFGLDFGVAYKLNDKFSFGASVLDLGFINWTGGNGLSLRQYSSNNDNFVFDASQFFGNSDSVNRAKLNNERDSLGKLFTIKTAKNKGYRSSLPTEINLSAIYSLTKHDKVGLLVRGEFFESVLYPSFTLSYNKWVGNLLSATVSYSVMNRSYNNIGLGLAINLGPWQIYVTSDNILAPLYPESIKSINVHLGMNLIFGYKETKPNVSLFGNIKN